MHARRSSHCPGAVSTVLAAALAAIIGLGVLGAVVDLFRSKGMPLGHVAAAERACLAHSYVSDRAACMHDQLRLLRERTVSK